MFVILIITTRVYKLCGSIFPGSTDAIVSQEISASMAEPIRNIGFKRIEVLYDQVIGMGAYGKVCRAKCDSLICAAKILHPTLLCSESEGDSVTLQMWPLRQFEQECNFLSTIRHPNIVQCLGLHHDLGIQSPVLLMELMDCSLTRFLESSLQPIHFHTQVNICHDITHALSFLHSNNIIHRDLSSNNIYSQVTFKLK